MLISLLKILIIATALGIASVQDIRTREIDDRVWLVALIAGALLTVAEILTTSDYQLLLAGFSIGLTVFIALAIFYTGLYGGADAKALITIAVTMPLPPFTYISISPLYPFTIFGNSLILSLLLIPTCAIINSAWAVTNKGLFEGIKATPWQKFGAYLTGLRVKPKTARSVHFSLIERVAENGDHYLKLFSRVTEHDEVKIIDQKSAYVWVTPAIPMILFFLAGYLLSFVVGDMLLRLIGFLMGFSFL